MVLLQTRGWWGLVEVPSLSAFSPPPSPPLSSHGGGGGMGQWWQVRKAPGSLFPGRLGVAMEPLAPPQPP